MSAFILDKAHIDALVTAAVYNRGSDRFAYFFGEGWHYIDGDEAADRVGQMLVDENIRSVSHRYPGESEDLPGPVDKSGLLDYHLTTMVVRTPVQVFKAINSYAYQACETPDWEASEAYAFCQALKDHLIRHLPGYDDADWVVA